jgi:hypothetical protein
VPRRTANPFAVGEGGSDGADEAAGNPFLEDAALLAETAEEA